MKDVHNPNPGPDGPRQMPPRLEWLLRQPWTYALMAAGIFALDLATGKHLMFPILFVIPVTLAAWCYDVRWAYALAILLPLGRLAIAAFIENPSPMIFAELNAAIRVIVLVFIAFLVHRTARQTRELQRELKLLEGILPICMFCKRIRDEEEKWQQLEAYIAKHSEAQFSHGLCPECAQVHYGDILGKRRRT